MNACGTVYVNRAFELWEGAIKETPCETETQLTEA